MCCSGAADIGVHTGLAVAGDGRWQVSRKHWAGSVSVSFFPPEKTKTTNCANILLWVKESTVHINIKKQDNEGERVVSQRSGYFSSRVTLGLCPVSCTTQRWQPGCGTRRR